MNTNAKMIDLFNYRRREASPVQVGDIQLGGDAPIRVQSMTTTNTKTRRRAWLRLSAS